MTAPRELLPLAALALASGCWPDFEVRDSLVRERRVLGVVADPPEARPGALIRYQALAVGPDGRDARAALHWDACTVPKSSVENNAVARGCYDALGPPLPEQDGAAASGPLPLDACARFGPDPPPGDARPRDADLTGGYYQPIIVRGPSSLAAHLQRILCNPRNAPVDVARELAAGYVPNQNPAEPALELDATPQDSSVQAGAIVTLTLRVHPEDAESYLWLDPATVELSTRREALSLAWFSTDGEFESDRADLDEDDTSGEREVRWTAPATPGPVTLWIVLRDSRGGTAFSERRLDIVEVED
jgi:hypothetical protein